MFIFIWEVEKSTLEIMKRVWKCLIKNLNFFFKILKKKIAFKTQFSSILLGEKNVVNHPYIILPHPHNL